MRKIFNKIWPLVVALSLISTGYAVSSDGFFGKNQPKPKFDRQSPTKQSAADLYYYYLMAQVLRDADDINGAIELYKKAVEADPSSPLLFRNSPIFTS